MKRLTWLVSLAIAFTGLTAQAYSSFSSSSGGTGVYILGLDALRYDHNSTFSGLGQANSEFTATHLNVKFGYVWGSGFYTGAIYTSGSFAQTSSGSTNTDNRTGYGVTLGYYNSGWHIAGSYLINSTYTLYNNNSFTNGSSYVGDFGYTAVVAGSFFIGGGLAYDSFNWTQQTVSGVTTSQNNTQTDLYPVLSLGFQF